MAIQNTETSSTSNKHARLVASSGAEVDNPVASTHCAGGDEAESAFINGGTYCWVCYSSNQLASWCSHTKEDTEFQKARNRIYKPRFGRQGDHRRQMQEPASRQFPPTLKFSNSSGQFNKRKHYRRNTPYTPQQGSRSNNSYQNPQPTVRLTLLLARNLHIAIAALSKKADDWASRRRSLWMQ